MLTIYFFFSKESNFTIFNSKTFLEMHVTKTLKMKKLFICEPYLYVVIFGQTIYGIILGS